MSIENKLTPNEAAKLEMYDRMESAFYDGVKGSITCGDNVTEREEEEVIRHFRKHLESIRKQWGMDKIYRKLNANMK